MTKRRLAAVVLAASTILALGGCTRGKSKEQKNAEAAAKTDKPAVNAVAGLDENWREGKLPPGLEAGTPVKGGTLVLRVDGEPPSLSYMIDSDWWLSRIAGHNIYESLVRQDPKDHPDYKVVPELAESWEESPDHLTQTFKLRKGVTWHDGKPFTAKDVKFSFDRLLDPVVRAAHLRQGFADLASVTTPDDHTVVLKWKKPNVWALSHLSDLPIYPAHAFAGHEGSKFNTAPYHRAPIGTGPFKFESWEEKKAITVVRNDSYWAAKPHLDKVVYRIVEEPNVAQQLWMRGEIDLDSRLSSEQYVKSVEEPKLVENYHRLKYFESLYGWIGWNQERPLFQDVRVRRALSALLDRNKINETMLFGLSVPANCVFYHLGKGCDPATKQEAFDPKRAAQLLGEAGWKDSDGDGVLDKGGKPFRFTLTFPSGSPVNEQMLLVYKQDLYRAGIEMELQKIEWSVFTGKLRNHEFDACMLAWVGDAEDDPYQVWHSSQKDGGSNYISYANPEVDRLAEAIRGEFDLSKRQEMARKINDLIVNDHPYTMLFHSPRRTLIHRRVKGVYVSPLEFFQVRDMWIDPAWKPATAAAE